MLGLDPPAHGSPSAIRYLRHHIQPHQQVAVLFWSVEKKLRFIFFTCVPCGSGASICNYTGWTFPPQALLQDPICQYTSPFFIFTGSESFNLNTVTF